MKNLKHTLKAIVSKSKYFYNFISLINQGPVKVDGNNSS